MNRIVAGFLCFICLLSCSSTLVSDKQVFFETSEFLISYPSSWEIHKDQKLEFIVNSPLEGDDNFVENFNVMKQDLTGQDIDLNKFSKISEDQVRANLSPTAIVESKREKDHHTLMFKGLIQGRHLKWKQHFYILNQQAYILTYTAEEKNYDKYSDIASSIFNSFKLK